MIRMLIVGYCYGIRSERQLCDAVTLHLAYRWFCRLDLEDRVPHHSTFSENRLGRFRDSDILRQVFERVVRAGMDQGLVKGEGFAIDASVMEADASRYHGVAPEEISWTDARRQTHLGQLVFETHLLSMHYRAPRNPWHYVFGVSVEGLGPRQVTLLGGRTPAAAKAAWAAPWRSVRSR